MLKIYPLWENLIRPFILCLPAIVIVLFLGCSGDSEYKHIDFSKTISVKQPDNQGAEPGLLRVAVAAMISPKETFVYYKELLDYIGTKAGYSVQLIQRKTYGEINELFLKRRIDLAFICTGPYATGKEKYGFVGLATPMVRGEPYYQSYLIVNKNSQFRKIQDLKDRIFAFTDPESNTGSLVPIYWLSEMGETPESFFRKVTYTYSHDNSILAVAKNLVGGATVDGHKWEYYNLRNPVHTSMTRVIKKSELFGGPPLVVSTLLPEQLIQQLRNIIFSMHKDPAGRKILNELMIDRFVGLKEEWYEPVRRMIQSFQKHGNSIYATEKS
jgi:phosphonate transport system substrate-binding protein